MAPFPLAHAFPGYNAVPVLSTPTPSGPLPIFGIKGSKVLERVNR